MASGTRRSRVLEYKRFSLHFFFLKVITDLLKPFDSREDVTVISES